MDIQNWFRLHVYPQDFLNLVYRYYAEHGISYVCTYYHFDINNSVLDRNVLGGGSYSRTGDLSGTVYEKITMFPIYNAELVQPSFTADERGFGKFDQITSFNFPSVYGLLPTTNDWVFFEEVVLNNQYRNTTTPTYQVQNVEKATNTEVSFWRVSLKLSDLTTAQLDDGVRETYTFFDYEKKIYQIDDSICMFKLLKRNRLLPMNPFFKEHTGYYFGV